MLVAYKNLLTTDIFVCLESVAQVFRCSDGSSFDYVINCAGETKFEQTEAVSALLEER